MEIGLSDLDIEFEHVCEFLKLDNNWKLEDPSSIVQASDYSVPLADLKINTLYSNAIQSVQSAMDSIYGKIFDASYLQTLSNPQIVSSWNSMAEIQIDDSLFNTVNSFTINSKDDIPCINMDTDSKGITLGNYFLRGIIANKFSKGSLQKLKNTYYAIVKPRFMANTVAKIYMENWKILMNSDGKSHDSVIFVLNTMNELVAGSTLPTDLSGTDILPIMTDSPFTIDSLHLYQTTSVFYELYKFVKQYPSEIQTIPASFYDGFQKYLDTLNKISVISIIGFVMKNPPDTNCINKLHVK
jgi:hypothetical protein